MSCNSGQQFWTAILGSKEVYGTKNPGLRQVANYQSEPGALNVICHFLTGANLNILSI